MRDKGGGPGVKKVQNLAPYCNQSYIVAYMIVSEADVFEMLVIFIFPSGSKHLDI